MLSKSSEVGALNHRMHTYRYAEFSIVVCPFHSIEMVAYFKSDKALNKCAFLENNVLGALLALEHYFSRMHTISGFILTRVRSQTKSIHLPGYDDRLHHPRPDIKLHLRPGYDDKTTAVFSQTLKEPVLGMMLQVHPRAGYDDKTAYRPGLDDKLHPSIVISILPWEGIMITHIGSSAVKHQPSFHPLNFISYN